MKKPCIQDGCTDLSSARELCRSHYSKARKAGMLPPKRPYEDIVRERFWSRVEKTESCWNWIGAKNDVGYGQLRFDNKCHYVHRLSYQWAIGPLPAGDLIDHKCHNPACVRPDHLRPVGKKQNAENMLGATRKSKSGYRGVWQVASTGRWTAQVTHNRVTRHVGVFDTAAQADAAATAMRNELFTHNDIDRIGSRDEAGHVPVRV